MTQRDIQTFAYANWKDIQSAHLNKDQEPPSSGSIAMSQDLAKKKLQGLARMETFKKWYSDFQGSPRCQDVIFYAGSIGMVAFAAAGYIPGSPWVAGAVMVGFVAGGTALVFERFDAFERI